MTKPFLVVVLTAAVVLAGLGGLVPAAATAESEVAQVPGNTVVQDDAEDFILINADPANPDKPCSLPPGAPLKSAPWTDIKTAKITQLDRGWVELSIALQEPVPETPPYWFVSYIWQFEGGCLEPRVTDKDYVVVWWNRNVGYWQGHWGVITSCDPRTVEPGDPVDFRFSDETVRVRVRLDDLMLTVAPGEELIWNAAVRRLPFIWREYTHTITVDVAPNVLALNPDPPPLLIKPELPAVWMPRTKEE